MSAYRSGGRSPGMVSVDTLATCSRCGDQQVAWVKSKAGKWYLVQAYVIAGNGGRDHKNVQLEANRFDFHSSHCRGAQS